MVLEQIYRLFPSEEDCTLLLEQLRWPSGAVCPYCKMECSTRTQDKRWRCKYCNVTHSVTVRTIFHRTRLDLRQWFAAIVLLLGYREITMRDLATRIGVNKNTACRINLVVKQGLGERVHREMILSIASIMLDRHGITAI